MISMRFIDVKKAEIVVGKFYKTKMLLTAINVRDVRSNPHFIAAVDCYNIKIILFNH